MSKKWALQDAKAQFSEVVRRANTQGPQVVTYRGVEKAVVVSADDFRRLSPKRRSFVDVLLGAPKLDDRTIDSINRRSPDRGLNDVGQTRTSLHGCAYRTPISCSSAH